MTKPELVDAIREVVLPFILHSLGRLRRPSPSLARCKLY